MHSILISLFSSVVSVFAGWRVTRVVAPILRDWFDQFILKRMAQIACNSPLGSEMHLKRPRNTLSHVPHAPHVSLPSESHTCDQACCIPGTFERFCKRTSDDVLMITRFIWSADNPAAASEVKERVSDLPARGRRAPLAALRRVPPRSAPMYGLVSRRHIAYFE